MTPERHVSMIQRRLTFLQAKRSGGEMEQAEIIALEWALPLLRRTLPQVVGHMVEFAALAGCRQIEFLDVAWTQVDEAAGVIRMKRAKQRERVGFDTVTIKPAMAALLARLPRGGAWLFTNRAGNPYSSRSFADQWLRCVRLAIKLGVITKDQRFNFHALRRYYTTMHRAEYGNLPDLHADSRITARVYDATKEIGRKSL